MKNISISLIALMSTYIFAETAVSMDKTKDEKMYLAHNIWYENAENVSAIGYKRGTKIPAGQEVSNVTLEKSGVSFAIPEWELKIVVVIGGHQKDLLTPIELRDRMFTKKTKDEMMKGFTDEEKRSVEMGYISPSIGKEAAIMAYGYPPKHRTPSTKMPSWVYWTSRFLNRTVNFDNDGKAINGIEN